MQRRLAAIDANELGAFADVLRQAQTMRKLEWQQNDALPRRSGGDGDGAGPIFQREVQGRYQRADLLINPLVVQHRATAQSAGHHVRLLIGASEPDGTCGYFISRDRPEVYDR